MRKLVKFWGTPKDWEILRNSETLKPWYIEKPWDSEALRIPEKFRNLKPWAALRNLEILKLWRSEKRFDQNGPTVSLQNIRNSMFCSNRFEIRHVAHCATNREFLRNFGGILKRLVDYASTLQCSRPTKVNTRYFQFTRYRFIKSIARWSRIILGNIYRDPSIENVDYCSQRYYRTSPISTLLIRRSRIFDENFIFASAEVLRADK